MDDIQERLEAALKDCKDRYVAWRANPKDALTREKLMEMAHELRRVGARLEIELAVAERNQSRETPIPIPPHRAAGRRDQASEAATKVGAAEGDEDVVAVKPRRIADGLKPKRTDKTLILSSKGEGADKADSAPVEGDESADD